MGKIDVTKVTAIEYLRKFVKIKKKENCSEDVNCCDCKYNDVSCLNQGDYIDLDIKDHIQRVMDFELPKLKINWSKVEKDTLIQVSHDGLAPWMNRYFAEYKNGRVHCYNDGRTSKTYTSKNGWDYARLVDDDE